MCEVLGVFPRLKLVLTEQSAGWVPSVLAMLDHQYERFLDPGTATRDAFQYHYADYAVPPNYSVFYDRNDWKGSWSRMPFNAPFTGGIGLLLIEGSALWSP